MSTDLYLVGSGTNNSSSSDSEELQLDNTAQEETTTRAIPKWTVMIYMAADNDLEYYGVQDMNELELVGSTEDVNLIVQMDRHERGDAGGGYSDSNGDWTDTRRFVIKQDDDNVDFYNYTTGIDTWELGEKNMASEETFRDFMHWGFGNYTAEHYMVVMWDHGEGISGGGRGGTNNDQKERTRGVCNDADGGWLNLWEMRNVLEEVKNTYKVTIDIIAFDVCWLGGAIETGYELMPYADYYAGSPEEEPLPGWDYYQPISYLVNNPNISPAELSIKITNAFKEEYKAEKYDEWKYATYVAVDLNRFRDAFIPLLNDFADALSKNIIDDYDVISNARKNAAYPHRETEMRDIFHFTSLIASDKSASTNVRIAANALLDEYNNTILRFISGSKQKDAMGPTVYFPDSSINNQYRSRLKFSNEHWDEFLELFLTPIQITHIPLNDSESGTGEFEITATIKGFSLDEENIFLFYTDTTSSNRITIQLEPTGNDHEYSAKFGLSNFGSEVHYCIRTTENSLGTHIYSPQNVNEGVISTWYSFYWGDDDQLPEINHNPSMDITGTFGDPYTFYVNISDNLGINPGSLYFNYNKNDSESITRVPLELESYPDRYKCTIPSQPLGTIIYYYFTAVDQSQNKNSNRLPEIETFEFDVSRVNPVANFKVSHLTAETYETITFTSTSTPKLLINEYFWSFGDGITVSNEEIVTHQYLESKIYTVTLGVADQNGLESEKSITITIINSPPQAVIQTDPILVNNEPRLLDLDRYIIGTVYEDDTIMLDCTDSIDKDGYIGTWTWDFGDENSYQEICTDWNGDGRFVLGEDKVIPVTEMRPSEQDARLNTTKDGWISFKYPEAGEYTIEFFVIDNEDESSSVQTVKVHVENRLPTPVLGYTHIDGLTVNFTCYNSKTGWIDSSSDISGLNFTWDFGDGTQSYVPDPQHTYKDHKKYEVTLTVIDDDGGSTTEVYEIDLREKSHDNFTMTLILTIIVILIISVIIIMFIIQKRKSKREQISAAEVQLEHEIAGPTVGRISQPSRVPGIQNIKVRSLLETTPIRSYPMIQSKQLPMKRPMEPYTPRAVRGPVTGAGAGGNVKVKDLLSMISQKK